VKIRTTVDRPGTVQGTVIDLPEDQAIGLVQRGLAVPVHVYSRTEMVVRSDDPPK